MSEASASNYIVVTRELDAPPEIVWKCWTEPEHLREWWAQHPFDIPVCTVDLRVGGRMFFGMHWQADGKEGTTYCGGNYTEIVPGRRLAMLGFFADKDGGEVPASVYGAEVWPDEVEISVELEASNGGTRMSYAETVLPLPKQAQVLSEKFDNLALHLKGMVS